MPKPQKSNAKLQNLALLTLSRLLPTVCDFYKDEKTNRHETEFNWNVVVGQVAQPTSTQGEIYTNHSHLTKGNELNIVDAELGILFY